MKRLLALVVLVLGILVLAGACSEAAPTPTSTPTAASTSTVETGKPIVIGAAVSQTGPYERAGLFMFRGYQLAVTTLNERGGIQERPLKLIVYDDQSDPATAVRLYQKLLTQDKVDILLGPYSSAVTNATAPIFEQAKMPTITAMGSDPRIWEGKSYRWTVQLIHSSRPYLVGSMELAAQHGAKTVALVYENTAFPIAMAEGIRDKAKELGMQIVLDEAYPKETTDFTPLASKAKAANADIFMGGGYFPASVGLTKATYAVNYKPVLMTWAVGPAEADYAKSVGDQALCVTGNSSWLPQTMTQGYITDNQTFVQRYKDLWHEDPGYHAAGGFGTVELLAQTLEASLKAKGAVDNEFIRNFLFTTETDTIFGHYKVVADGPNAGLQTGMIPFQIQWQKDSLGKMVQQVVHPEEYATAGPCFLR
ncbi:MAG: amino acid ABC transporter substrate-binding protein [Chloroflexi bacterium]|nr:amino acid ABC transporter substrate-binding protein [Chloroflexota bacterium]